MKKLILGSALVGVMGIGALSVYADATPVNEFSPGYSHMSDRGINLVKADRDIFTDAERQEAFDERQVERSAYREDRIQLALSEGWITEEEAVERRAELAERNRSYEENGFSNRGSHHHDMRNRHRQSRSYGCH